MAYTIQINDGAIQSNQDWSALAPLVIQAREAGQAVKVWRESEPEPFLAIEPGQPVTLQAAATLATAGVRLRDSDVAHLDKAEAEALYGKHLADVVKGERVKESKS